MLFHIALAAAICLHTGATANIPANVSTTTTTVRPLVEPSFREDCEKKGGRARVPEKWQQGAICDCGDWAAMDESAGKCVRQYYYTVSFKLNTSLESQNCSVYAPRVKAAVEIEEENLCHSLLKEQENAYNGVNECVKAGDFFWFKCKQGYREVKVKTRGRLKRSICEDPCLTVGAEVCGDVRCEPYSDHSGFTCKCGIDFFFDATEKRCYNMKSCKVHKCERGICVDQNGTFPASCQCNDYSDLMLNCRVKEAVRAICTKQDKVAKINPDNSVSCECPPHTKLIRGSCKQRTKCHEEDVNKCEREQKTCFYDNGKAMCRCPDYTLEVNGTCIVMSTKWSSTLQANPPRVLLDKIRTCEHPYGNDGCFFPPALRIVKDSVSGK
ncbi:hypothetical protein MTO96_025798 [Rhipicephalus appendiculatus]